VSFITLLAFADVNVYISRVFHIQKKLKSWYWKHFQTWSNLKNFYVHNLQQYLY